MRAIGERGNNWAGAPEAVGDTSQKVFRIELPGERGGQKARHEAHFAGQAAWRHIPQLPGNRFERDAAPAQVVVDAQYAGGARECASGRDAAAFESAIQRTAADASRPRQVVDVWHAARVAEK